MNHPWLEKNDLYEIKFSFYSNLHFMDRKLFSNVIILIWIQQISEKIQKC